MMRQSEKSQCKQPSWWQLNASVITAARLRDNLLIYGLGGVVAPFVGIKLIDLILVGLRLT